MNNSKLAKIEARCRKSQGERLKMFRNKRHLNQTEFGKLTHHSQSTVSLFEQGKKDFNIELIKAFSKALNITPQELLGLPF